MQLNDLDHIAIRHHGLVTMQSSGLSRDAWYRAVRAGTLDQVHPGVARLIGTPRTLHQQIAAAVLAVGSGALSSPGRPERHPARVRRCANDAMASHRSAAWLWMHGGAGEPRSSRWGTAPIDVLVSNRHVERSLEGVSLHRPTDRRRLVPQRVDGIRCTNILRTLVDLGAVDPPGVHDLLGHVLSTGLADLAAVEAALQEHRARGRAGITALRSALDDWSIDTKPADSVLEIAFTRLVARHGLPLVEFHPRVEGWEVDFRFVGTRVIVECDGWASHGIRRDQFERDRRRDADLTAAGWTVVRFTYRAITDDPTATARRLRAVLAARAAP